MFTVCLSRTKGWFTFHREWEGWREIPCRYSEQCTIENCKLFISGNSHLIFPIGSWLQGAQTMESKITWSKTTVRVNYCTSNSHVKRSQEIELQHITINKIIICFLDQTKPLQAGAQAEAEAEAPDRHGGGARDIAPYTNLVHWASSCQIKILWHVNLIPSYKYPFKKP